MNIKHDYKLYYFFVIALSHKNLILYNHYDPINLILTILGSIRTVKKNHAISVR